jgi:hypothetical protein
MGAISSDLTPLILDFLEWIETEPRSYADVMDAWRTSCPRLTVWEDSQDRGLITRRYSPGIGPRIEVTPEGRALLADFHRSVSKRTENRAMDTTRRDEFGLK